MVSMRKNVKTNTFRVLSDNILSDGRINHRVTRIVTRVTCLCEQRPLVF